MTERERRVLREEMPGPATGETKHLWPSGAARCLPAACLVCLAGPVTIVLTCLTPTGLRGVTGYDHTLEAGERGGDGGGCKRGRKPTLQAAATGLPFIPLRKRRLLEVDLRAADTEQTWHRHQRH